MNRPTLSRLLLVAAVALAGFGFAACASPTAPANTAAQSAPAVEVAAAAPVESPQNIAPQDYDARNPRAGDSATLKATRERFPNHLVNGQGRKVRGKLEEPFLVEIPE